MDIGLHLKPMATPRTKMGPMPTSQKRHGRTGQGEEEGQLQQAMAESLNDSQMSLPSPFDPMIASLEEGFKATIEESARLAASTPKINNLSRTLGSKDKPTQHLDEVAKKEVVPKHHVGNVT